VTAAPGALPPPSTRLGPGEWLRRNLFSTWYNAVLTVVVGALVAWFTLGVAAWATTDARWGVITSNLRLFLVGQYPFDQAWRIWLSLAMLGLLLGVSAARYGGAVRTLGSALVTFVLLLAGLSAASGLGAGVVIALVAVVVIAIGGFVAAPRVPIGGAALAWAWFASAPVMIVLLYGLPVLPLPIVGTNFWGGLLLTFLIATFGIVLSFPFGVLLALGRRSSLPAVSLICTAYIELIRGVPLITIIFMADLLLPLFLPGDVRIDRLARAIGGITLFSAAYVAENVRGGLQAIPGGQIEAAQSLGLGSIQTTRLIVLPQALRAVIPANVGLFISLLKDTTLVVIVGLLELLGIGRAVLAQPEWFGAQLEVYVFVAAVFFVLCSALSRASYRLEAALGVGTR